MHGGATPRGRESANWKHGRYSQYPDGFLMKIYYESQAAIETASGTKKGADIVSKS
jgi:hypothetical protein